MIRFCKKYKNCLGKNGDIIGMLALFDMFSTITQEMRMLLKLINFSESSVCRLHLKYVKKNILFNTIR